MILFIYSESITLKELLKSSYKPVEISDELLKEEEACSKAPDDPLDQLVLCCYVVDPWKYQ